MYVKLAAKYLWESSGLWKHRKRFPDHNTTQSRPKIAADEAAKEFLSSGNKGKLLGS